MIALLFAAATAAVLALCASPWRTSAAVERPAAWLAAFLSAAVMVWLSTELWSSFSALSVWTAGATWIAAIAVLLFLLPRRWRLPRAARPGVYALLAGVVLVPVAVTALASAPNNWDSLTYHLARVAHWQVNGGLSPYPTHIVRQLHAGPFAEMAVLQTFLFTGGDRAANLVQLGALAGAMIAGWSIAEALGAGERGRWLAVLGIATIPMAVLQASSTQNDLVVAFLVLSFAAWSLRLARHEGALPHWIPILTGASLGLALLTKATAFLYVTPFALWMAWRLGRARIRTIASVVLVALVLNVPHFARNVAVSRNPLGRFSEGARHGYLNELHSPAALASNAARNVALQLATPSAAVNDGIARGVRALHALIGLSPDDPRTTWGGARFALRYRHHEDHASNVVHFLLIGSALAIVLARRRELLWYGAMLAAGALLFIVLLKWQPWHSRLHLPLFALAMPMTAVALEQVLPARVSAWLALLLVLNALPFAVANETRPLTGPRSVLTTPRESHYFSARRWYELPYRRAAAAATARCTHVGLVTGSDGWEYPLWALAGGPRRLRVEHLGVSNETALFGAADRVAPCSIFVTAHDPRERIAHEGAAYVRTHASRFFAVFEREGAAR